MASSASLPISKSSQGIILRPVNNILEINKFIRFPKSIYRADPAWIAPLGLERHLHFSALNPFFKHGEWQAWLAWRNGHIVGRICAQIDYLHREIYGADSGHFGLLEAIEDPDVFAALCGIAEKWLVERGTRQVTGPMAFSLNQECGLLVEGFQYPPVLMMPHSAPWYGPLLEKQGYLPARDLLAYWVNVDFTPPRVMTSLLDRYAARIRVRCLDRKAFAAELAILRDLFNDAWSQNWGFVPFTEAEFAELGASLRLLVPDDYVQIAEMDGEAVAFIVALPNINEIIRDLDGRLLPLGWWKIIQRLRHSRVTTGRVPLMGVRKKLQHKPVGMALAFLTIDSVRHKLLAHGIREVEMSWILEDNSGMRNILDSIGSRMYKRYRLYRKTLADPLHTDVHP